MSVILNKKQNSSNIKFHLAFFSLVVVFLWFFPITITAKRDASTPFLDPLKHDIMPINPKTHTQLVLHYSNRKGVTMLLHYSSDNPSDKTFIEKTFNVASNIAQGMVRFAAIDCAPNKQFCKDNLNPNLQTPLMILYPPSPIPPIVVQPDVKEPSSIANMGLNYITENRISTIKSSDEMKSFMESSLGIPKLIFFSTKETPPTLLKALSNHFSDRIDVALVPGSAATASLRKSVKARAPPSCIIIRNSDKGTPKIDVYNGNFTFPAVRDWVNIHAETFVKGGGFYEPSSIYRGRSEKPWLKEKIPEMTGQSYQDICFREKHICAIFVTNGPLPEAQRTLLEKIVQKQQSIQRTARGPSLKWSWLDLSIEKAFAPFFNINIEKDNLPIFLILKTKQLRFTRTNIDLENIEAGVTQLVERLNSGDARFVKVTGSKIPAFAGRAEDSNISETEGGSRVVEL